VLWSHAFNLSQLIPRRVSWYCAGMGDSPRVSHRVEERLKYQACWFFTFFTESCYFSVDFAAMSVVWLCLWVFHARFWHSLPQYMTL